MILKDFEQFHIQLNIIRCITYAKVDWSACQEAPARYVMSITFGSTTVVRDECAYIVFTIANKAWTFVVAWFPNRALNVSS